MTCKNCPHPIEDHGDRALIACQHDVAQIVRVPHPPGRMDRFWHPGQCNCPGWA